MRLGQLSRKLNIPIPELVSIVANEFDVTIGEHPNIKLDDSHVEIISKKFDKSKTFTEIEELKEGKAEIVPANDIDDLVEETSHESSNDKKDNVKEDATAEEDKKEIETIRAKAAKLEGLKVVDKIDLPEPPPPEMVEIDGVMYDKAELKKQRIAERKEKDANRKKEAAKRAAENKTRVKKKPVKKELTFAQKRIIEDKKEADKKKTEDKFKRKRQRKHYDTKHKVAAPTKNKKKKKAEVIVETQEVVIDNTPAPKTMFGKLWRWLNSY
jgi:hypothetical protein